MGIDLSDSDDALATTARSRATVKSDKQEVSPSVKSPIVAAAARIQVRGNKETDQRPASQVAAELRAKIDGGTLLNMYIV